MEKSYFETKKSKFYGYLFNLTNESEIEVFLSKIKTEHKKATHFCYAYSFNVGKISVKCCDGGEPSGTAGKPILNIIEKKKLSNVLICVVRYFGGIKLGAGGLIRAYSKCASLLFEVNSGDN